MDDRLAGKVVVVTGSGGSIGRAACLRLASEGAIVVGGDRDEGAGQETCELVRQAGGTISGLQGVDLSNGEGAKELIALALTEHQRIDGLFNNAALAHFCPFEELDHQEFAINMRDELDIVFHCCKAAWPAMKEQRNGAILNMASVSALIGYEAVPGLAHSTAKAGVLGMTRHLAMEGASSGIRVNALSPGLVLTNQSAALFEDVGWQKKMMAKIMLDRPGAPADIAAAAAFLLSTDASWITGSNLVVDGGTTAW